MLTLKTLDRTPSLAELKVSYRRRQPTKARPPACFVTAPVDCETYLRAVWDPDTLDLREEFVLVCLSGAHEVLGWVRLYAGGYTHAPVDLRLVLGVALRAASTAIIVAHNHPSGGLTPSPQDRGLTEQLAAACRLVGLRLLDHLILTRDGCYSFADHNQIDT